MANTKITEDKKAAPSVKVAEQKKITKKAKESSDEDPWGAWSENEIDPSKVDYNNLNLNKLNDKELSKHKKAMEVEFNKKKIWKDHPEFEYDVRKDFTKIRNEVSTLRDEDDDW